MCDVIPIFFPAAAASSPTPEPESPVISEEPLQLTEPSSMSPDSVAPDTQEKLLNQRWYLAHSPYDSATVCPHIAGTCPYHFVPLSLMGEALPMRSWMETDQISHWSVKSKLRCSPLKSPPSSLCLRGNHLSGIQEWSGDCVQCTSCMGWCLQHSHVRLYHYW